MFVKYIIENLHLFLLCTRNDVHYSRKVLENSIKAHKDRKLNEEMIDLPLSLYIHLFICTTFIFLSKIIHDYFGNNVYIYMHKYNTNFNYYTLSGYFLMLYCLFFLYELSKYKDQYVISSMCVRICKIVFLTCDCYWRTLGVQIPFDGNSKLNI